MQEETDDAKRHKPQSNFEDEDDENVSLASRSPPQNLNIAIARDEPVPGFVNAGKDFIFKI